MKLRNGFRLLQLRCWKYKISTHADAWKPGCLSQTIFAHMTANPTTCIFDPVTNTKIINFELGGNEEGCVDV